MKYVNVVSVVYTLLPNYYYLHILVEIWWWHGLKYCLTYIYIAKIEVIYGVARVVFRPGKKIIQSTQVLIVYKSKEKYILEFGLVSVRGRETWTVGRDIQ